MGKTGVIPALTRNRELLVSKSDYLRPEVFGFHPSRKAGRSPNHLARARFRSISISFERSGFLLP